MKILKKYIKLYYTRAGQSDIQGKHHSLFKIFLVQKQQQNKAKQ